MFIYRTRQISSDATDNGDSDRANSAIGPISVANNNRVHC